VSRSGRLKLIAQCCKLLAGRIPLNLAEGRGKPTVKDQKKFFSIAFGSLRECQAILTLAEMENSQAWRALDNLAAHLYKLIERA